MAGRPKAVKPPLGKVREINWKELAEKLQDALAKERIEVQRLESERGMFINDIAKQVIIIQYLESKFR